MTVFSAELEVKRFELLNEIVPRGRERAPCGIRFAIDDA